MSHKQQSSTQTTNIELKSPPVSTQKIAQINNQFTQDKASQPALLNSSGKKVVHYDE